VNVIGVLPSAVPATLTCAALLGVGDTVARFELLLFRLNDGVCAYPDTTVSSAVARNRTVLLKYV
jgi:hypothetical protein